MKRFLITAAIMILSLTGTASYPEEAATISSGVEFNWVDMQQFQRDEAIETYREKIFGTGEITSMRKKEFRKLYADYLKDPDYKANYRLVSNGATETVKANLCGFFTRSNILYSYAVQYKESPKFVYYYSAFGKLAYVDESSENYPNYPYYSKQLRANGKLSGAIYFMSKDLQYVYEPDGKFKGVWYKENMFDQDAKQILTRSNW